MAFNLGLPRDLYAEFYLNSQWTDLIHHIRQNPGIVIERGRKNEQAEPASSGCAFWMDDGIDGGNGDYTSRNPMGQYYPYWGRNVPVRTGLNLASDDFNDRTSSAGWLGDWINGDVFGGTIADTDWAVSGGTARHIVPNQGFWRGSYYNATGAVLRNCEQRVTLTRPNTNVLGGRYGCALQFRVQDTDNYVYAWITIDSIENLYVQAIETTNGVGFTLTNGDERVVFANPGLTTEIRAQIDGSTVRVKAWPSTADEPLDWQVVAPGVTIDQAGQVGILSWVDGLNTNADPHTFQYDNWSLRLNRFSGETSEVTPDMDLSENVRVAKVDCGTVFRRMEQGKSPIKSTLNRFFSSNSVPGLINYWSCEEDRFSSQIASGLNKNPLFVGGPTSTIAGGLGSGQNTTKFAADDTFACSAPLPHTELSTWVAEVPAHTNTGEYALTFMLHYPEQTGTPVWLMEIQTNGSINRWHIQLETDGSLSVRAFAGLTGIVIDDNLNAITEEIGALWYFTLTQDGADVDYLLFYISPGSGGVATASGTAAGHTLGRAVSVGQVSGFNGVFKPSDMVLGHIAIGNDAYNGLGITMAALEDALIAFYGESAARRMTRLAEENGLAEFAQSYADGSNDGSALMGPQLVDTLINLLKECAATDHGLFGDSRGDNCFSYIPVADLYGRSTTCTLDHDLFHLAEAFEPTDDDALTVNDVNVKARRGSSARMEQTTGDMNVDDPGTSEGAVGRYEKPFDINPGTNEQLAQSASWLLHLGTTNESRYPAIPLLLHAKEFANDPELTLSVLDLDTGDVLALQNLQKWFIYDDVDQLVLGYTEHFDTQYVHEISFNTAPYSPYRVGVLGQARIDSSNSTLDEDIDTTATVFDVTTPGTSRWVVEADQINTARITAASGTTTTAVFVSSHQYAGEINVGDNLQLYTSVGVLKEATVFTVTNIVRTSSQTTVTFSPAAATAVVTTNVVRTWYADNFPFDIVIGGERMTVTDINLTSDPQQFVVVRSVNDVVQSHSVGDPVHLFEPFYFGK